VGETSANNKKSPEDLISLLDLKRGGKRYEITTWVAKRTAWMWKLKKKRLIRTLNGPFATKCKHTSITQEDAPQALTE